MQAQARSEYQDYAKVMERGVGRPMGHIGNENMGIGNVTVSNTLTPASYMSAMGMANGGAG